MKSAHVCCGGRLALVLCLNCACHALVQCNLGHVPAATRAALSCCSPPCLLQVMLGRLEGVGEVAVKALHIR